MALQNDRYIAESPAKGVRQRPCPWMFAGEDDDVMHPACTRFGSLIEEMPESFLRQAALFGCRHVHHGKFIAPMPGPAGIDHGAAVGVVARRLALRPDPRIKRR